MQSDIYVNIVRENDKSVYVEASCAAESQLIFRRSLNLWRVAGDDEEPKELVDRIKDLGKIWYERKRNLALYCQRALQWVGSTAPDTQVVLTAIDEKEAMWRYHWRKQQICPRLRFGDEVQCVDWVCAEGLTPEGQDFILDDVIREIAQREQSLAPAHMKKRALIESTLALLPRRQPVLPFRLSEHLLGFGSRAHRLP